MNNGAKVKKCKSTSRDPECNDIGATGTHTTWFKYHQNPKFTAEACLKSSVHDLMKARVCSIESEKCMMGQCKDCPGQNTSLIEHLNV